MSARVLPARRPTLEGSKGLRFARMADACGVSTGAGYILHERWRGIDCPVKLMVESGPYGPQLVMTSNNMPIPLRLRGALVFALPGGGELVPGRAR